jgi:simple sugar transport system substrate-binding protein
MKGRSIRLASLIFTLGIVAAACGGNDTTADDSPEAGSAEPIEVVFVYENPAETKGWEDSFEAARRAVEEEFGEQVVTSFQDRVPASPEGKNAIKRIASEGPDLIIGTSFGHGKFMQQLAAEFPEVHFMMSQFESPEGVENFSGYDLAVEDGWYLSGVASGMVAANTGQNLVGWIDGFPIPFELRQINGFALGYQESVPDGTVRVTFINSWYDPNAAAQASNSLLSAGADMLASGIADPTIGEIAEQRDVPYSAVHPLTTFTSTWGVTGPEFHWEAFFVPKIQAIMDGTWEPTFDYFGAKEGAIDVAPFEKAFTDNVSQDQIEQYEQIAQALKNGEFEVLPGTTKELTTLEYVVPGVEGVDLEVKEISPPRS